MQNYEEKKFSLSGIKGLSDKQITEHLKLYAGYVKNTNGLLEKIDTAEKSQAPDTYTIAELRRRLGFEFNGMRLHEYYFEALGGDGMNNIDSTLYRMLETQYGSFGVWLNQFKSAGMMRGIGWVILYFDPATKMFHNAWITDHEVGHLAGLQVVLAMDVWEHAFLLDYLPSQRKDYIEAFFNNLNWQIIESRIG
jgi:Fe-Mn family superoxide dismutase